MRTPRAATYDSHILDLSKRVGKHKYNVMQKNKIRMYLVLMLIRNNPYVPT